MMSNFDWNNSSDQADFGIFIQDLEDVLELPEASNLASEENARNIWAVTGGYRGRIAKFMFSLARSEEHTSELQSLMRISYAVFCLKKKNIRKSMTNPMLST